MGALQGTLRLQDLQNSAEDIGGDQTQQIQNSGQNQVVSEFGASFWVDDMAGFPLPPLDLDPLPPGLFSPCSGTYKWVAENVFSKKKISLFLFSKLYKIYSNFHLMRQIHFISRLSSQFDVFTLKFKFVFPLKYIILHLNIYIYYMSYALEWYL